MKGLINHEIIFEHAFKRAMEEVALFVFAFGLACAVAEKAKCATCVWDKIFEGWIKKKKFIVLLPFKAVSVVVPRFKKKVH